VNGSIGWRTILVLAGLAILLLLLGVSDLSDQVVEDVRRVLGEKVYTTIIPRNVRVAESPSHGKPVLLYDYRCSGSQAYIQLASEVIERERRMRAA